MTGLDLTNVKGMQACPHEARTRGAEKRRRLVTVRVFSLFVFAAFNSCGNFRVSDCLVIVDATCAGPVWTRMLLLETCAW